jgi:TonB-linked SusC/RagA family outer membrane protein
MEINNSAQALDGTAPDFPDELIEDFIDGTRRAEDWWDAMVDAPIGQWRQSLTMRGGTERVKYFTSIGMANQGGIITGDNKTKLRQFNIRSNIDVSVTESLDIGFDLTARKKLTDTPQGGAGGEFGYAVSTSPLQEAFLGGDTRYPAEGWSQLNPLARVRNPGYKNFENNLYSGILRANWDLPWIKGLSLGGFASFVDVKWYEKSFNWTWEFFEYNPDGEIIKKQSRTVEEIGLRENFRQSQRATLNAKLAYQTSINDVHNISAFVAYEQEEYDENYFWTQRLGYDSPFIDQLFAGSTDRSNFNNSGAASESARQNYFGRVTYDFKRKYLFGLNFRYDGSPIFPEETRFGFFPGVSAGWLISEEEFMGGNAFSNLKLRASWGQTGNDRVDPFQYIARFGYAPGWVVNGMDQRGIAALTTPNPEITWEVTENTNIGLEVGFLQDRLNFEIDVFKTKTSDILGTRQASIPQYTGLELPDENIGEMENRGFEFVSSYRQTAGDWTFSVSGNVGYQENKIIYFDEVPPAEEYQKLEGFPLGSGLVYKAVGIYRTQDDLDNNVNYNNAGLGDLIFADLNDDGLINGNDRYMSDITDFPTYQYGINLGANYKGFDLDILFAGQGGGKWRLWNGFSSAANGNGLKYVANNSYTLENTDAELPRVRPTGLGASNSDFWYVDSNWLRLRSLELGYSLPSELLSKVKIQGVRVYFSGENLFLVYNSLDKYQKGDPMWNNGVGADYPNMRTLNFGLNLTF